MSPVDLHGENQHAAWKSLFYPYTFAMLTCLFTVYSLRLVISMVSVSKDSHSWPLCAERITA